MDARITLCIKRRRTITECGYTISKEGMYHPDRVMHEFDLIYVAQGNWEVTEGKTVYPLNSGDLLILEPGKHHYGEKKNSPDMRYMYIHFRAQEGDLNAFSKTDEFISIPKYFHSGSPSETEAMIRSIIDIYHNSSSVNKAIHLSAKLENLLLDLESMSEQTEAKSNIPPELRDILSLISSAPERFFSLDELASYSKCSIRTLSKNFKAATGMSPYAFQLEKKLELIHNLLKTASSRTLRDIAISYGFYDEFQLSKLFKKKYGISPSECRGR